MMTEVEKYEYGINHQIKTCTQHISEILIQHEYYQNIYNYLHNTQYSSCTYTYENG